MPAFATLALAVTCCAQAPQERFPLGPAGASATVTAGEALARIVAVEPDAPAARCGLRVGDALVAIGGARFDAHGKDVDDGGDGPQRALGEAIDAAGDGADPAARTVVLTVARDGATIDLHMALAPRPSLAGAERERARAELRTAASAQLLAARAGRDHWDSPVGLTGDRVLTAWALIALLAHGDPSHRAAIDEAAVWLRGPDGAAWLPDDFGRGPDNLDNWAIAATSIALSEHHLATGDAADLAVIARCDRALAARMDAGGRMGHDIAVGYGGKGFNVINAQAQLAFAVAAAAGVAIDESAWTRSREQLEASVDADGGVRYWTLPGTGTHDASLRTSAFALALSLRGEAPELQDRLFAYLRTHARRAREAHAVGSLGMLVQAAALRARDRADHEDFLAEWRWYLALMRGPDDRVAYIGGKRNNGGDSYLGFDRIACVIALHLLACGDGRLRITRAPAPAARVGGQRSG